MKNEHLVLLHNEKTIRERVGSLADQICQDYRSGEVFLVGVLKGAFVFLADLIRELKNPVIVDFVQLSSYGTSTSSSGKVKILKDLDTSVKGKNVIIVEDIIDTGLTIRFLKDELGKRQPQSLKVCAFLDKKFRRQVEVDADYVGIAITEDYFLVGYGLDFAERYRNLSDIYYVES